MRFAEIAGQKEVIETLLHEAKAGRMPHARMFAGAEGSGKLQLALALSQYILCDNPGEDDSCGQCSSCKHVSNFTHPDLHLSFPISLSKDYRKSDDYRSAWVAYLKRNKYISINGWLTECDELGKLPQIAVEECANIQHKLLLRTALGKFKILIMWQGEYMNNAAANKLLKLIEEPPEKTLIFLTCSNSDQLPATILSRTQVVRVPVPEVKEVDEWLGKYGGVSRDKCEPIAAFCQGNISLACQLASNEELLSQHFEHFVKMMRAAYSAVPIELMDVSELLAGMEREQQKDFLIYSLRMVRECLLQNYLGDKLTHLMPNENAFLNKFAKFINNQNIDGLIADFNEAHVHLTRNANPKILFTDLMIRLTKLIKKSN